MRDYFPIRDSKRLECVKVLLKEEILLHYKNSQFFRKYANSNKMSGVLHIDAYYINLISIVLPSRCFLFKIFLRCSKLINKTKDYIYV